jgi:hypothetical protein
MALVIDLDVAVTVGGDDVLLACIGEVEFHGRGVSHGGAEMSERVSESGQRSRACCTAAAKPL